MPPLLDRRFGIQLATTNGATTKWQLATGNVPAALAECFGMLCVVPMHVGTWPLFYDLGFFFVPHSTPIQWHFEQSSSSASSFILLLYYL